uniref:Calcitonin peptide-like domain-containing protein n=1 Tax=Equus caballus TaxID=9796 RepID=F6UAU8_HORSE
MGFWKFSAFLPVSILVLYQAGILQAASLGDMLESLPDPTILAEEETQLLLAGLVKEYMQLKALQQETESYSLDSPRAKRCSNLSTYVLGTYPQDLNKSHFPTTIGLGMWGKNRVMVRGLEGDHGPPIGTSQDAY